LRPAVGAAAVIGQAGHVGQGVGSGIAEGGGLGGAGEHAHEGLGAILLDVHAQRPDGGDTDRVIDPGSRQVNEAGENAGRALVHPQGGGGRLVGDAVAPQQGEKRVDIGRIGAGGGGEGAGGGELGVAV